MFCSIIAAIFFIAFIAAGVPTILLIFAFILHGLLLLLDINIFNVDILSQYMVYVGLIDIVLVMSFILVDTVCDNKQKNKEGGSYGKH